ncbi:hypothetical protein [Boudabousia marimammalium]|uniref:Uncharacterized protein n=1 Tax=Boudabousia marimammalium TaxID=156892 RepID=A0A1Q5PSN2_9ACTO|nr:hypothetical protein [Boudabousia marimammalium]OKL50581.1 hypothetical protein BM477_01065 [Boudabousia marimammalium]
MYSLGTHAYGFETAKKILGLGSNSLGKLVDLGLISVEDVPASQRNQNYSGWDLAYLASARNRPLLIDDNQRALVCSMGVERSGSSPSVFFDLSLNPSPEWLESVQRGVDPEIWEAIEDGSLRVSGYWRVSQDDTDFLVKNHSILVASYAGFILDGGVIVAWIRGEYGDSGGRCFVVKPFSPQERYRYAHNFLASRQGPPNRVWSAEELKVEALKEFKALLPGGVIE